MAFRGNSSAGDKDGRDSSPLKNKLRKIGIERRERETLYTYERKAFHTSRSLSAVPTRSKCVYTTEKVLD